VEVFVSAEFVADSVAQRNAVVIGQWCGETSRKQSSVQSNSCRER
jgi:hypothetical protein